MRLGSILNSSMKIGQLCLSRENKYYSRKSKCWGCFVAIANTRPRVFVCVGVCRMLFGLGLEGPSGFMLEAPWSLFHGAGNTVAAESLAAPAPHTPALALWSCPCLPSGARVEQDFAQWRKHLTLGSIPSAHPWDHSPWLPLPYFTLTSFPPLYLITKM